MATKNILKNTTTEAVVKVYGSVGSVTITVAELKLAVEDLGPTPSASIVGFQVTGDPGGVARITRNGAVIYSAPADASPCVDLLEMGGVVDSTNSTHDIVVTTLNAETQVVLKLRKAGFVYKIKTAENGLDTPV